MASTITCSLCSFTYRDFKYLYDDNGKTSEVYQIAVKYFNPSLLNAETEPNLRVICLECWQHISDFHSFQEWIINAQALQQDLEFIINDEGSSKELMASDIADFNNDTATMNSTNSSETNEFDVVDDKENENVSCSEINGKFKCDKCKEIFQSRVALDVHFQLVHSNICSDKNINTKTNFVEHENDKQIFTKRSDENSFKCETCGASFSQYGNLRRHIRKKHRVQPLLKWICKYCNKMFKNRTHLERHKHKLHNRQNSDNLYMDTMLSTEKQNEDIEENHKINSGPDEVALSEESRILNHNGETDSGLHQINLEKSKVGNGRQSCYKTRFSETDVIVNKNIELNLKVEPSLVKTNSNMQIQMPALDIIDIKDEISTDVESDEDRNQLHNITNSNELHSDIEGEEEDYEEFLAKWEGDLQCPRCNQHIKSYLQLTEHFTSEHPEERCYIICCHITLYERQSIAEHLQYHENPKAFECADCGKCFKNKKGLCSHKLQVHSDHRSAYHLHLCYCKKAKEQHVENTVEGQQNEYETLVCCQRKKKILEDDALIAKWKKEFICELCQSTFSYYSLMRVHFYREHPGEKCYIFCCQRKMSRISDALQHIRFHLDPHAYRCQVCNIDFSGKNTLAKHMRSAHTDCLPKHKWACDECDKTFEIRQILTRHKNVCHSKKV